MKLYTEEQVRELVRKTYCGDFYDNDTPDDLVNELTPIELPSDEEIDEQLPNNSEGNYVSGFYDGVDWLINHIKQQDNDR